jgi:HEXXH motif-containing protein
VIEPHPIFVRVLQNMKTGSLGKDSSGCNPLPSGHPSYIEHNSRIAAAMRLLREHCPDFYFLVSTFLRRLILVDDKSSFRGATTYYARGLAYFRPRESWDAFVWAEELVHEATHNQVHSLLTFDRLVTGENRLTQNVPGPLRPDMRHHFGNFQALHVISRLLRLNETLAAAGLEPDGLRARNAELMERCRVPVRRLASEAQLTEVGQALFAAEIEPAFVQALCGDGISADRSSRRDTPASA